MSNQPPEWQKPAQPPWQGGQQPPQQQGYPQQPGGWQQPAQPGQPGYGQQPGGYQYGPPPKKGGNGLLWTILIVLLVLVLAAGGLITWLLLKDDGDTKPEGIPTNASSAEFCGTFQSLLTFDTEADPEQQVERLHQLADDMRATGTPADIPAEARDGFEDSITALEEVTAEDIESGEYTDPSDMATTDSAFADYVLTTCAEGLELPEVSPGDTGL